MSLPVFGFVSVHERPLADGIAAESGWMASAARTGRAAAHLWRGEPGLVVPRSCTTLPGRPPRRPTACGCAPLVEAWCHRGRGC